MVLNKKDKIALVACSNALSKDKKINIDELVSILKEMGLEVILGNFIFSEEGEICGSPKEKAADLMKFYKDEEVKAIFDISGGDLANEVLPYLDFNIIKQSHKMFWGYSDLTTVINAIYAKTGSPSCLYQIRNLIKENGKVQIADFKETVFEDGNGLLDFGYSFYRGESMRGVVVGGNIRCLLKLAGTEYFPDVQDKILLLESCGGQVPKMVTYLNQLKQMGVFEKVSGIMLGTFSDMEKNACKPDIVKLVLDITPSHIPVAKTGYIGHGADSKAIVIGKEHIFKQQLK